MSHEASNKILSLQQEYLLTGDTQVLITLYKDLLHFALYILRYGNYYEMSYTQRGIVVSDIVTSIITRLMTKKKIVIKDSPLTYLARSILYASKQTKNNKVQLIGIDDYEGVLYSSMDEDPTLDEALIDCFDAGVEQYVNESLSDENEETRAVLKEAFYSCIYGNKLYAKFAYKVKGIANRDKFLLLMKNFQEYLHRNQ